MRIGNLEFRNKEIVCWYPNPYYGNEDKYEKVDASNEYILPGVYYINPEYPHQRIHQSCFEGPESCIIIAEFKEDESAWKLEFIGDRPLDGSVNWMDFRTLVQVGFNELNKEV